MVNDGIIGLILVPHGPSSLQRLLGTLQLDPLALSVQCKTYQIILYAIIEHLCLAIYFVVVSHDYS